jgi:ABC-type transport system involved in cytochrome c biogenesis ATPase subunit
VRSRLAPANRELLETVELSGFGERKIGTLSKGPRQRLGWTIALAHAPRLLILDKPTSGLDPEGCPRTRRLDDRWRSDGCTTTDPRLPVASAVGSRSSLARSGLKKLARTRNGAGPSDVP